MADDIAVAAISQRSLTSSSTDAALAHERALTPVDRAERGIEILSRWTGILAFVGAVAALVWLIA